MLKTSLFNKIIIWLISIHLSLLAIFLLFFQYFQQDEWHGFGIILSQGLKYITLDKPIPELLLGDRVGARVLTFGLFNIFHLNPLPYGLVALSLHSINTFLVFIVARRLTNQRSIALLSALFFLVNELGNEAYSWFGTMNGSATSVLFFLISLYLFLKFIDTNKFKFTVASAFILWLSFLFKEISAFAFILYPIIFFTYTPLTKKSLLWFTKKYSPFIIITVVFLLYFAKTVLFIPGDQANYVSPKGSFVPTLLTHSLQYPLEGIVQTFIPNSILFLISPFTTRLAEPNLTTYSLEFLIASQDKYAEVTIVIILMIITPIIAFVLGKKWKNITKDIKRVLIISPLMIALSFLPYVVLNRSFSYLDSRHYYMATIGASTFLATLLFSLLNIFRSVKIRALAVTIGIIYVVVHEVILFEDFKLLYKRSNERQVFLRQVENFVPNLSQKTVFYITGDSGGYYGLEELKVPFQSGLGQVLMVTYVTGGQLNPDFFKEETLAKLYDVGFLYDILGQGYREVEGQGFGYYFDHTQLQKALDKKLFTKKDVVSLYYDNENKKLTRRDF